MAYALERDCMNYLIIILKLHVAGGVFQSSEGNKFQQDPDCTGWGSTVCLSFVILKLILWLVGFQRCT
jgi:hypothetical protein